MQENTNTEQEIANSDKLSQVLASLTLDQIRFIAARQHCSTDKDAARKVGLKPSVVYQWRHKGIPLDEASCLIALHRLGTALHIRQESLVEAMLVKIAGLKSKSEKTRQSVATEIIEWEMGRAAQPIEGNVALVYVGNVNPEDL